MNAAFDQFQRKTMIGYTKANLKSAPKNGRMGGRPLLMTKEKRRTAKAMLKDTENYPFIYEIIKSLSLGRNIFYWHFHPEEIQNIKTEI